MSYQPFRSLAPVFSNEPFLAALGQSVGGYAEGSKAEIDIHTFSIHNVVLTGLKSRMVQRTRIRREGPAALPAARRLLPWRRRGRTPDRDVGHDRPRLSCLSMQLLVENGEMAADEAAKQEREFASTSYDHEAILDLILEISRSNWRSENIRYVHLGHDRTTSLRMVTGLMKDDRKALAHAFGDDDPTWAVEYGYADPLGWL